MLERPDEGVPPAERVTDAERDQVIALLRTHCADGRLTLDEFSDRVTGVLAATTRADLETVAAEFGPVTIEGERTTQAPARTRPARETNWVVGVMCGGIRKGRWRPAERVNALAFWGGCHLDFRAAELTGSEITVTAVAIMGGIEIVVPEGVRVEIEGIPIMGGVTRRIKDMEVLPGTPVIKVKAFALCGGVTVRSKPSRSQERGEGRSRRPRPPRPPHMHKHGHRHRPEALAPPWLDERTDDADAGSNGNGVPDGTVTILFSDIEDFTVLTERLGDLKAQEVLRAHNELLRAQIAAFGGREVKCQGDSFMVSFAGARRGLRCAVAIQRAMAEYAEKHPEEPVRVRIGLHTGEAIREANDLFGRSVIMASRVADQADGGAIVVSSLLKELVDSSGEFRFGEPRTVTLKGLTGEHLVYPVEWD